MAYRTLEKQVIVDWILHLRMHEHFKFRHQKTLYIVVRIFPVRNMVMQACSQVIVRATWPEPDRWILPIIAGGTERHLPTRNGVCTVNIFFIVMHFKIES